MPASDARETEEQLGEGRRTNKEVLLNVRVLGVHPGGTISILPAAMISVERADLTLLPVVSGFIEFRLNDALVLIEDLTMGTVGRREIIAAATYALLAQADGEPCRGVRLSAA
jgi:hypothetical protein